MARLRRLRHLYLLVLLCQLLVLGVATAAPWVNPQPYGPLCSAGGAAGGPDIGSDTLDCPACLPLLAPPPAQAPVRAPAHTPPLWWQLPAAAIPDLLPTPLPPVRGPPSV